MPIETHAYCEFADGQLLALPQRDPAPAVACRVHDAFRALILDPEFPCVGARSAINQASYRFGMYQEMASAESTNLLAGDLASFVSEQDGLEGQFSTFIACFDTPKVKEPLEFEGLLWRQLAGLHVRDEKPWDETVSADPSAPNFSFSFSGHAFFVVGLSPAGTRWARSFPWPLLAFNPHAQFEELRKTGQFDRMQDVIRERDIELEGTLNPNLANFGEHTEARQYAGREVDAEWRCPVAFT